VLFLRLEEVKPPAVLRDAARKPRAEMRDGLDGVRYDRVRAIRLGPLERIAPGEGAMGAEWGRAGA